MILFNRLNERGWRGHLAALVAGALQPLALAPFSIWPLGLLSAIGLMWLLGQIPWRQRMLRASFFGLGVFGAGTSWVYISIHDFGMTSASLASVMTLIFVAFLGWVFSLPFIAYSRRVHAKVWWRSAVFAGLWVLGEWSRSWLLTGFPWMYLGYGYIDTPLAGLAPHLGVFGVSFAALASAFLTLEVFYHWRNRKMIRRTVTAGLVIIAFWLAGAIEQWQYKQDPQAERLQVATIQPNIPLFEKWNPLFRDDILDTLRSQTETLWDDHDLIVWPEAAVPMMYHEASAFLDEMDEFASASNTGLILGILYDDEDAERYYNGITGVGRAGNIYFKQRLVPFGEYVPLEDQLRGIINFFDLPMSIIHKGPPDQDILTFDKARIAPSICYEIVYPDLVARIASNASLLITISNDAWFGKSIGPIQHYQMARMRALENRRFVIRATNTGISGIFDPHGREIARAIPYERAELRGAEVALLRDRSVFSLLGSAPIVLFCIFCVLGGMVVTRKDSV